MGVQVVVMLLDKGYAGASIGPRDKLVVEAEEVVQLVMQLMVVKVKIILVFLEHPTVIMAFLYPVEERVVKVVVGMHIQVGVVGVLV